MTSSKSGGKRLSCGGVAEADAQLVPLKSRNDGVAAALPDNSESSLTCGVFRLGLRGRGRAVCGVIMACARAAAYGAPRRPL